MATFSDNDSRLLEKTLQLRERIVDKLFSDNNIPSSGKELDSVTNLLESIDRSILGKAKIKIEDVNAKANEESKAALKELLLHLHKNVADNSNIADSNIPEYTSIGIAIKDGELIPKVDDIDYRSY